MCDIFVITRYERVKGTSSANSQMSKLWFFVLKLKGLGELQPIWKFQWISMFNTWDNWDQSFYDIPNIYDIPVLFPYKEITKILNSMFSKTTQRNLNIFSEIVFQLNTSHFMPKKWGKKKDAKFIVYLTIFSLLYF